MAVKEFELKDIDGVDTEIGDEIIVDFPEIDFETVYGEHVYREPITARCRVLLPPSQGLSLKLLEFIDGNQSKWFRKNQLIKFRRTKWHWRNITKPINATD